MTNKNSLTPALFVILPPTISLYRFFRVPNSMHSVYPAFSQNSLSMSRACSIEVSSFKAKPKSSAC